jgi:two-component system, chemotaxis family, sensor kinase CheA
MNFEDSNGLFLEEARDLLAKIENSLVALEKQPGDKELVNEIFRGLHTIKGSGAMFGFQKVSDFTHHVENLFDEVRNEKVSIDSRIIDIGLRSTDCISLLLDGSDAGEERKGIISDIARIGEEKKKPEGREEGEKEPAGQSPFAGESNPTAGESLDAPTQVFRIVFKPQPQILHRGVKIEPLFQELSGLGICHVEALCRDIPDLDQLDPTALYLSWILTLSTVESPASIRSVFMFVEDYSELSVTPVEMENNAEEATVPRLGEILVNLGMIKPNEVEEIRAAQKLFGEAAIDSGRVSREQVDAALAEQAIVRTATMEREVHKESATVRVRKEKLDNLIDLVGELVILQAMLEQEAKGAASGIFGTISENLSRLTADLRDSIMSIRMVQLAESFASFQRLVRDLAAQLGKELRLEISGADTELDKNVIELLKDPLVHIIRNSADHGIELPEVREKAGKPRAGTISLGARQVGSRVEITIADDGAGLNIKKIRERAVERKLLDPTVTDETRIMAMIFEPGFSTAEKTTGVSGRGVGMDVVKRNIESLRGEVSLRSEPGRGMTVTLSIPLTLVIIEGLLVLIAGHNYVVTLSQVEECVDLTDSVRVGGSDGSIINLRGKTIPVISLREALKLPGNYGETPRLVIVSSEGTTVGLAVDKVLGRKQVVIKPLSGAVKRIKAIFGATILGDGSVALILDVTEIIKTRTSE